MRKSALLLAAAILPTLAAAQTAQRMPPGSNTAGNPVTVSDGSRVLVQQVIPVDANGNPTAAPASAAQGSTTSGQSGTLSMCAIVTGNQTYTAGTTQPLNCITTGRLKVGVSSAGNIDPATQLTTTLTSDLGACKYYATRPTWADQYTGSVQCDVNGNQYVNTVAAGGSTAANQTNGGQKTQITDSSGNPATLRQYGNAPSVTDRALMVYAVGSNYSVAANGFVGTYGNANGTFTVLQPDGAASSGITSTGADAATSAVIKNAPGNLYRLQAINSTAAGFLVVLNATTAPASGTATPVGSASGNRAYCMPLAASQGLDAVFQTPLVLSVGIVAGVSTSCATWTPVGTAPVTLTGQAK